MKTLLKDIVLGLGKYISGQIAVAVFLGLGYAVAYKLVGLPFPLAVGLITGLLTFVPFLGPFLGFVVALSLSVFSFFSLNHALMVAGIYIVGQLIEGYYLTPKWIGEKTGLHPILIFLSILAGGALFGVVGMMVAVPVALVVVVVLRYIKNKQDHEVT